MVKISNSDFKKLLEVRRVIAFNDNGFGGAVVTTGVPVYYQPEKTSYVMKKKLSYERFIFNEQRKS